MTLAGQVRRRRGGRQRLHRRDAPATSGPTTRRSRRTSVRPSCWSCTAAAATPADDRRRRRPRPSRTGTAARPPGRRRSRTGSIRTTSTGGPGAAASDRACRAARCPEVPLLVAPTVADLQRAAARSWSAGIPNGCSKESLGFVVAAMSLPNVLTRLREDYTVIAPGDRSDVLPALILAHQSATFPHLSSIVLTGGYTPPESVQQLHRRRAAGPADPGHARGAPSRPRRRWPACAAGSPPRSNGQGRDRAARVRRVGGHRGAAGRDRRRRHRTSSRR